MVNYSIYDFFYDKMDRNNKHDLNTLLDVTQNDPLCMEVIDNLITEFHKKSHSENCKSPIEFFYTQRNNLLPLLPGFHKNILTDDTIINNIFLKAILDCYLYVCDTLASPLHFNSIKELQEIFYSQIKSDVNNISSNEADELEDRHDKFSSYFKHFLETILTMSEDYHIQNHNAETTIFTELHQRLFYGLKLANMSAVPTKNKSSKAKVICQNNSQLHILSLDAYYQFVLSYSFLQGKKNASPGYDFSNIDSFSSRFFSTQNHDHFATNCKYTDLLYMTILDTYLPTERLKNIIEHYISTFCINDVYYDMYYAALSLYHHIYKLPTFHTQNHYAKQLKDLIVNQTNVNFSEKLEILLNEILIITKIVTPQLPPFLIQLWKQFSNASNTKLLNDIECFIDEHCDELDEIFRNDRKISWNNLRKQLRPVFPKNFTEMERFFISNFSKIDKPNPLSLIEWETDIPTNNFLEFARKDALYDFLNHIPSQS